MAEDNNPRLPDELEHISQVIARNIEELRRHIFDLRPIGLENRSIYKVLRQTTHEFGEQTGLESHCRIIGDEIALSAEVEASLYRIFQEALSNIRRHAKCTRVEVVLRTHLDKSVEFSIRDNGVGFHLAHLTKNPFQRHGLGLISMQERIRSLGGTLSVDSAPNKGTRIMVNVPGG
jgi:two-component system sensor histidine kinase DegS